MRFAEDTKIENIVEGGHRRAHFLTVIPTLGMVPIEFLVAFGRLQSPVNAYNASLTLKGMEIGEARNYAIENVLKMPASQRPDYVFFLGDDMIPPWDGLVNLYTAMETREWDVLTGLYYWKGDPPTPLVWRRDTVGPLQMNKHYEQGDIVEVDVTGMDFTLIRTSKLEKIAKPYFKSGPGFLHKEDIPIEKVTQWTEDVWFCERAQKAGLRIGVHTGVRVAHLDIKTGTIW